MLPGPFAYAERWDETAGTYQGLAIDNSASVQIVIDSESLIGRPDIAEAHRPQPQVTTEDPAASRPHRIESPRRKTTLARRTMASKPK